MSRRAPNPSAERAAQNQQTLKTLVKVEGNKSCADCKRNKHPRWASWNLGIFVCIRCSGIHRGMGTHISRVKSVDLDAWTDEQLQSMVRWGNARANKYWEAKLAPGHVPAEAKIENFIRTKYDSKRWVMDGGMPDPATLDVTGDDEVSLKVVQEKATLERSASLRTAPVPVQPPHSRRQNPDIDLFGDDGPAFTAPVASAAPVSLTNPPVPSKTTPAAPRPTKAGDSLLGFDFFGSAPSGLPARPSSAAASISNSSAPSRPDLKQSILSLYSSNSRSSTPGQAIPQSPPSTVAMHSRHQSSVPGASLNSLDDDFRGLSFSSPSSTQPAINSSRSSTTFPSATSRPPESTPSTVTTSITSRGLGGGSFFDIKHNKPIRAPLPADRPHSHAHSSASGGFGDFEAGASPVQDLSATKISSNGLNNMLDFSLQSTPLNKPPLAQPPSQSGASPFNLSAQQQLPPPKPTTVQSSLTKDSTNFMNMDPWGSNEAWATSTSSASLPPVPPGPSARATAPKAYANMSSPSEEWGWGSSGNEPSVAGTSLGTQQKPTVVTRDEDFGGWESSAYISPSAPTPMSKPAASPAKNAGGFASNDNDLFSNVWE